jgi:hypothetical protein
VVAAAEAELFKQVGIHCLNSYKATKTEGFPQCEVNWAQIQLFLFQMCVGGKPNRHFPWIFQGTKLLNLHKRNVFRSELVSADEPVWAPDLSLYISIINYFNSKFAFIEEDSCLSLYSASMIKYHSMFSPSTLSFIPC